MKKLAIALIGLALLSCNNGKKAKENEKPAYAKEYTEDGKILVDETNFTIAETDLYMVNHSKDYEVNTFRHSRKMSDKDNQFVVRENQDVQVFSQPSEMF